MGRKRSYGLTKKKLIQLYTKKRKTATEIARKFKCPKNLVYKRLHEYDIQLQGNRKGYRDPKPTKAQLEHLYCDQEKSLEQIAQEMETSYYQVRRYFEKYDIERRRQGPPPEREYDLPTKEELRVLYHDEGMSTIRIGRLYGTNSGQILNLMKKWDIPRRTLKEAWECRQKFEGASG